MHDLLAAQDILKNCLRYAKKNKLKSISKIVVDLGKAPVHHDEIIKPKNLKFLLNLIAQNTILEKAKIEIYPVDGSKIQLKSIEGK